MKNWFGFLVGLQVFAFQATIYAQEATPEADSREQGMMQTFTMIAIALIFFYLILWRPEQKRRKSMEEQRSALKKGDRVTAMGIIGTIVRVEENTVILRMVDGSKIEMLKAAINDVIPGSEEDLKKADKEDKTISIEDLK